MFGTRPHTSRSLRFKFTFDAAAARAVTGPTLPSWSRARLGGGRSPFPRASTSLRLPDPHRRCLSSRGGAAGQFSERLRLCDSHPPSAHLDREGGVVSRECVVLTSSAWAFFQGGGGDEETTVQTEIEQGH